MSVFADIYILHHSPYPSRPPIIRASSKLLNTNILIPMHARSLASPPTPQPPIIFKHRMRRTKLALMAFYETVYSHNNLYCGQTSPASAVVVVFVCVCLSVSMRSATMCTITYSSLCVFVSVCSSVCGCCAYAERLCPLGREVAHYGHLCIHICTLAAQASKGKRNQYTYYVAAVLYYQ